MSSNDVWAVGYYTEADTFKTLAMHWDGRAWTITPTANPSLAANQLKKVIAISTNDVWTVGGHGQSYTLHWNGAAWTQVALPPITNRGVSNVTNYLEDIAAVASNDIWMVGSVDSLEGGTWTLTMHWNGATWTQVPSPNVTGPRGGVYPQGLDSVIALAPNDVWAAGFYRVGNVMHPLIQHWNGTQWMIVQTPDGPSGDGWLHGIAAASPNDIWAVGEYSDGANGDSKALALHWDGAQWSAFVPPNPSPAGTNPLHSIVARGPNDFYAVGSWETAAQGLNTFVVHWDGANWTQSSSETPAGDGTGWNPLLDVGRDANGEMWAVGKKQADFNSPSLTLVQRANLAPNALAMTSVVSRKVHGAAGTFDIELSATGAAAVESRLPTNGEYTLVYSFSADVSAVDGVTVQSGLANVASRAVGPNPNQYTVRLTGVADLQHLVVQLDGVRGQAAALESAPARMDIVVGDVNSSRTVSASDISMVKTQVGSAVTSANFRADVTGNGAISSSDLAAVKAHSGGGLP